MFKAKNYKLFVISFALILTVLLYHGSWPFSVKSMVYFDSIYPHGILLIFLVGLGFFVISYLFCKVIISSVKWHGHISLDDQSGLQKYHNENVPRVGGLGIYLALLIGTLFIGFEVDVLYYFSLGSFSLLLVALPIFFGGLVEDITKKLSPFYRIIFSIISASLFVIAFNVAIANVDVPLIDLLLTNRPVAFIFTVFAITGMVNSINIIDGFHGLASGLSIIILIATSALAYMLNDIPLTLMSFSMASAVMGFFVLNWPLGKLFLGDCGAYLIGFILGSFLILLQQTHLLSPWMPLNLLAYPITETIYSIVRRLKRNKKITNPDSMHMHHLIFKYIDNRYPSTLSINPLVAPCIWVPEIIFAALTVLNYQNSAALIGLFSIHVLTYIASYKLLR